MSHAHHRSIMKSGNALKLICGLPIRAESHNSWLSLYVSIAWAACHGVGITVESVSGQAPSPCNIHLRLYSIVIKLSFCFTELDPIFLLTHWMFIFLNTKSLCDKKIILLSDVSSRL